MNEHLFCKYFVRLSVGIATKGFAAYGCFHPCFIIIWRHCNDNILRFFFKKKNGNIHKGGHQEIGQ